jgi:hypothetical protein
MECLRCAKGIKTKLGYVTNSHRYCRPCFVHIMEKRFRKHVRQFGLNKDARIVAKDDVSCYFLENIVHVPLTLLKRGKQTDVLVSLDTADDAAVVFLERLMLAKKNKQKKNVLCLFHCFTDEELSLYCQYKKMTFTPKKNSMKTKLSKLEQQHPGTLHALEKSMSDLAGLL